MSRETFKTALIASLCGTLAGVAVQAAPRPVPAPAGLHEQALSARIHDLELAVQDAEQAAWDWRAFQRCTHQRVVEIRGGVAPVTWKLHAPGCLTARTSR